jgi:hypothetical protein
VSYSPTKPIVIGGTGVQVTGPAAFTGGVLTRTDGRLNAHTTAPTCNTRSRTIFVPLIECGVRCDVTTQFGGSLREDSYLSTVISGAGAFGMAFSPQTLSAIINIPRRYLHQGSRLASVVLAYRILAQPAALPSPPPSIAMFAAPIAGGARVNAVPIVQFSLLWAGTTAYAAGALVVPNSNVNGFYFQTTAGGTSGSSEPNPWPSTIGATVTDGSITWTCVGHDGRFPIFGATTGSYYAHGAPQTLEYDTFGTGSGANVIDTGNYSYAIQLTDPDPTMIVTGLTLAYDTINDLRPE